MKYDLIIQGGTLIDGTGKAGYPADVAILDGKIAAIGKIAAEAEKVLDAHGAIVTPGFVDIHTHYDGQISWDAGLAPSSLHGVTTAVLGSCGVGFAPCRKSDQEKLIALMEGVEDIPGSALAEGLTWNWESFPEYMNALDAQPHSIDFCLQMTHDPLRVYVMGDRAVHNQPASPEEIAQMRQLLREGLEAGAVGFSTGRSDNHRSATGAHTPAAEAQKNELSGIVKAFEGLQHGVVQAVSDFDMPYGDQHFEREFDLLEEMAKAAGRPLSISLMQRDQSPEQWRWIMRRAEAAQAKGLEVKLQVGARAIGVLLGLETTFHPFMGFPSYKAISHLPLAERVKAMSDPAFKAQLLTEKNDPVAGDGSPIPPLADMLLAQVEMIGMRMFTLGENPDYEPSMAHSIGMKAKQRGESVLSGIYDAMLENEGHALIYFPLYNYIAGNLDNTYTMLSHPQALPGLGDGGAHVGTICDASFPTFMISHWARDRQSDKFTLEQVIKMQTQDTAAFIGLKDRGTLEVGKKADLNIIEFENLRLHPPYLVADLPAGGKRLMQKASGYRATLVSGEIIAENGELTGAYPGRLVRLKD
ncbi:amidohydrolase [bacterium (Candidatus Blackallbacteria) CG17_big_fil_post_rev_8_21_14_2_50_48_46]|uniref:Amidohydrolase n=1 Tax=bacterium (Candidatus Blackallbacteria) CG17_big_fil_post_rev_8_21_14_2_50_48_46 TaxID=2014261 RepID=A0A2M7G8V1_9BACT|nr:MAG: amidohydrolase [bacterium (Candidatus Blackallbacteria) CG18_big_fil_WC_8_21_14_2_50_49_26]PIW18517.1 MAG: amidohydrolase [bacterium (Candidatus Blackallbacteria) CG17_big_fil_post_rev_8_21_14_2_50_48_46]PIW46498.1 MAG: amidohydrolase [bacterium (Candidatus Blackallbacteria) CG13_big_fil_rev_8_21_14_2_50_49_14]